MGSNLRRAARWFAKQPVGIRAALITAVAGLIALGTAEWHRERSDARTRIEQRQFAARQEMAAQIVPQLRNLVDLLTDIGTSMRIEGHADQALVDSLGEMVEYLLVPLYGTGARVARAFTDSIGIEYAKAILAADNLLHDLFILRAADTVRTEPEVLKEFRDTVQMRLMKVGRMSVDVLNTLLAYQ